MRHDGALISFCLNCTIQMLDEKSKCWMRNQNSSGVAFCCCSPSASKFDVLRIHRCSSGYLGCNDWLPSYQLKAARPFFSDLRHQQDIFTQRATAHWIFYLSWTILCKPQRWCRKITVDQQFVKLVRPTHPTSPFFPILMLILNFSRWS